MLKYIYYQLFFIEFIKTLKLLSVMLLLNYIAPCEATELLYVASSIPSFFKTSVPELNNDKLTISSPLSKNEINAFNSKFVYDPSYKSNYEECNSISLKELDKEHSCLNKELFRNRNISSEKQNRISFLRIYMKDRVSFYTQLFLKRFLQDEIEVPSELLPNGDSYPGSYKNLAVVMKKNGYDNQKIKELYFLINFLYDHFKDLIPSFCNQKMICRLSGINTMTAKLKELVDDKM